jgi:ribonuclease/clavin/mitogillin
LNAPESSASSKTPARAGGHREAGAVILLRFQPCLELFWVLRAPELAYLGGFHAFPGGRVSRRDRAVPMTGVEDEAERIRRVAAAREIFEETGVLLAHSAPGAGTRLPDEEERRIARLQLQKGELDFEPFLSRHGLVLDGADFRPAGRWISPPFSPRGFDTYFYLARLPEGEEASIHTGELVDGEWIEPAAALKRWQNGEALLARPVRRALELLIPLVADGGSDEDALGSWALELSQDPEAQGGSIERIEIVPGAALIPLKTPTIPPATHTNCVILGEEDCLLIDPGSGEPEALAAVDVLLRFLETEGRRVTAIAVTHHHIDHTGGVDAFRRRLGVPLFAHPDLAASLGAEHTLTDGDRITLANGGGDPWVVETLFTPGHSADHVAFFERQRGVLAAGDLISSLSTVVIDPPDGDLGAYMESLRRIRELPVRLVLPGHGPPIGGGRQKLDALIQHRQWREDKVVEALAGGEAPLEDLLPHVYDDVPEKQWGFARRSLLAHLLHLEASGRAHRRSVGGAETWKSS